MGKIIGAICIISAICALFFFNKIEGIVFVVSAIGGISLIIQLVRNFFFEGIIKTALILIVCILLTSGIVYALTYLFTFSEVQLGAVGLLIALGMHLIYCSIYNEKNYSKN